jgi:molybdenum cofactor guanylyltransferase
LPSGSRASSLAIEGYAFLADEADYQGPLVALSRFSASAVLVFIASCDLPAFDASVFEVLLDQIGAHEAAIPVQGERLQPLCALYRAEALGKARTLVANGENRVMRWIDDLDVAIVPAEQLPNPGAIRNVNTPEELG